MKTAAELLTHLNKVASGPLEEATSAEPQLYWNEEVAASEEANIFRKD